MSGESLISTFRRNRVTVTEYLLLVALIVIAALISYEFDLFGGFQVDHKIGLGEMLLLEAMTIGAFALFTWRWIQEKEREIRRRMRSERRALQLANEDPLTKVANRRRFSKILNAAASSPPEDGAHALLLLDLNGFKLVNDRFGHCVGDALLVTFAKRLSALLIEGETVARLGGDEFAVIAPNIPSGRKGAEDLAARILTSFQEPLLAGSVNGRLGLGIGIALITRDRTGPDELLRRADVALYRAKAFNRSTVVLYQPEMEDTDQAEYLEDCMERLSNISANTAAGRAGGQRSSSQLKLVS